MIDFDNAMEFNPGEILQRKLGTTYFVAPEVLLKNYNESYDVWL